MEWLVIPIAVVAAIVWLAVSGRGRMTSDTRADATRAGAEAERRKFDWFGTGGR